MRTGRGNKNLGQAGTKAASLRTFPHVILERRLEDVPLVTNGGWPHRHRLQMLLTHLGAMTHKDHGAIAEGVGMPMRRLTTFQALCSGDTAPGEALLNGPLARMAAWAMVSPAVLGATVGTETLWDPRWPHVTAQEILDSIQEDPSDPWPQRLRMGAVIQGLKRLSPPLTTEEGAYLSRMIKDPAWLDACTQYALGPWQPDLSWKGAVCGVAAALGVKSATLGVDKGVGTCRDVVVAVPANGQAGGVNQQRFGAMVAYLQASGRHTTADLGRLIRLHERDLHCIDDLLADTCVCDDTHMGIVRDLASIAGVPLDLLVASNYAYAPKVRCMDLDALRKKVLAAPNSDGPWRRHDAFKLLVSGLLALCDDDPTILAGTIGIRPAFIRRVLSWVDYTPTRSDMGPLKAILAYAKLAPASFGLRSGVTQHGDAHRATVVDAFSSLDLDAIRRSALACPDCDGWVKQNVFAHVVTQLLTVCEGSFDKVADILAGDPRANWRDVRAIHLRRAMQPGYYPTPRSIATLSAVFLQVGINPDEMWGRSTPASEYAASGVEPATPTIPGDSLMQASGSTSDSGPGDASPIQAPAVGSPMQSAVAAPLTRRTLRVTLPEWELAALREISGRIGQEPGVIGGIAVRHTMAQLSNKLRDALGIEVQ